MRIRIIKAKTMTQQKKKRVAAYVRVSTDSMEQEGSLVNQSTYYESFLGNNPDYEFVGIYSDQGISGYEERRPGFQKMIEDARDGKIELIYVKSVSRFARNTEIVLKYSRELKQYGVGIYFELQNINTLSSEGELMLTILAAFAQAESENYRDTTRMAVRRKYAKGEISVAAAKTYGFEPDEYGGVRVLWDQAAVIRKMFELAYQGMIPSDIKKYLNHRNIPSPSGGRWDDTGVHRVLRNVMYKGDVILQKTYKDGNRKTHKNRGQVDQWYIAENHTPIVEPEVWEAVQKLLDEKPNPKSRQPREDTGPVAYSQKGADGKYLLTGLLYCPKCGAVLHHKWCNKKRQEYWACSTNIKKSAADCKGIWLPAQIAEEFEITEPSTVIENEDEYGNRAFTTVPKRNYERRASCPYKRKE